MVKNVLTFIASAVLVAVLLSPVFALECPKFPEQAGKEWEIKVSAEVAKLGPLKGAELKTTTRNATRDLLGTLPDSGRVYLEQMMFAAYCSTLRDDKTLTESEKAKRLKQYIGEVRRTISAEKEPKTDGKKPQRTLDSDQPKPGYPSQNRDENITQPSKADIGTKTDDRGVTVNAPGGVVSVGQQGGITAKEVTINTNAPTRVMASEQRQIRTNDPLRPWATVFTITSTGLIATGDLKLKCTGPAIRAAIERINPYSLITGNNGPDPKDPTTVVYELGPEMLSAGRSISVSVYSKDPVTVISGSIGGSPILFQAQKSGTAP